MYKRQPPPLGNMRQPFGNQFVGIRMGNFLIHKADMAGFGVDVYKRQRQGRRSSRSVSKYMQITSFFEIRRAQQRGVIISRNLFGHHNHPAVFAAVFAGGKGEELIAIICTNAGFIK